MSTPELIEFDSATLVTYVLVTVADGWLADPAISLEIEITGLNGGNVHYGFVDIILYCLHTTTRG